jgi:hypothetical protein
VQLRIDRRRWESDLAFRPPSFAMNVIAVSLGVANLLGLPIFVLLYAIYGEKGYARRAKSFAGWFCVGVVLFFVWLVAQWIRFRA